MWRPWFEPDISTEVISDDTDVTVIPEIDEAQLNNKVDETTLQLLGYHADTPIAIKAESSIWPTAAFINIHEHPI